MRDKESLSQEDLQNILDFWFNLDDGDETEEE
jgi:hypothetical protein